MRGVGDIRYGAFSVRLREPEPNFVAAILQHDVIGGDRNKPQARHDIAAHSDETLPPTRHIDDRCAILLCTGYAM